MGDDLEKRIGDLEAEISPGPEALRKDLLPAWLWQAWIQNEKDEKLREVLTEKFKNLPPSGMRYAAEKELLKLIFPRPGREVAE